MAVLNKWATYDDVRIEELRERGNSKWRHYPEGVLAAWVAEMDFPLAPAIQSALEDALRRGFTGYAPADEATGLPQAVAAWFAAHGGPPPDTLQVRLLPDVLKGIELAVEAYSPPGSAVIVPTPAYPPFFSVPALCGRPVVPVPMLDDAGSPRFDPEGIGRAFAAGARTLIVCNPHNPLGRAFDRRELAELAAVVDTAGGRVIADEVHAPLIYPGATYTPYVAASAAAAGHAVTLTSASKGWNVPGLKCALAILSNAADAATWDGISRLRTHGASTLGIVANRAAFTEGQGWLEETIAYLDRNRRLLGELLADLLPEVGYRPPEGTYLAWLDCRRLGLERPAAFFLEHARVAVSEGANFGEVGAGFVRFNFATSAALLERIVRAMAAAIRAR